ncbi:MAG: sulfotransferase [Methylomicrobium sp.]|nr:sulfotransferase [Methylomicrobium sp.]
MSAKHSSEDGRTEKFSRNLLLENLLKELNAELWLAERALLDHAENVQRFPVVLLMGPIRSGTTLFMQWLVNTGLVAYPSNLLSRFYQAPILGAKIQLLLTDPRFNFRDELGEFVQQAGYDSENGKTQGVLAPNEFWYFWRRFLAEPSRDVWSDEELEHCMDAATMKAELTGVMNVMQKPFAAKAMLFNYNIPFLDAIFDKALFVQIERDPVANAASILEARKRQLGSEKAWYSFKIPEYERLQNLAPVAQVAGQLHYINQAVTQGMAGVAESRKLRVQYEDFCANPGHYYELLRGKLGMTEPARYSGPDAFRIARPKIDTHDIKLALQSFGNQ